MCVLHRAFQAETLPALVLNIMSGTKHLEDGNEGLKSRSSTLRKIINDLLNQDSKKRPNAGQLVIRSYLYKEYLNFYCDFLSFCFANPKEMRSKTANEHHVS